MKLGISILEMIGDKLETTEIKEIDFDNNFKDEDYEIISVYSNSKDEIESGLRINYYKEGDEER